MQILLQLLADLFDALVVLFISVSRLAGLSYAERNILLVPRRGALLFWGGLLGLLLGYFGLASWLA